MDIALQLFYKKEYNKAIQICDERIKYGALRSQWERTNDYLYRGMCYFTLNQFDKAIADFTCGINLDGGRDNLYSSRAETYFELGRYKEAIEDYKQVIMLHTTNLNIKMEDVYSKLGHCYYRLNQYRTALENYLQALRFNNHPHFYKYIGDCYFNLNLYEEAVGYYHKACEINAAEPGYWIGIAKASVKLNVHEVAILAYSEAIRLDNRNFEYCRGRGDVYVSMQQFDNAIKDFTQAIALNNSNAETYNRRGSCYLYLKQYDKAREDYSNSILFNPRYAGYYGNRGNSYSYLQQYDKAIEDYSKAIELQNLESSFFISRGNAYAAISEDSKALEDYNRAIQLNAANPNFYITRGEFFLKRRQQDKAIADYSQAIQTSNQHHYFYTIRGNLYVNLKDYDRGIEDYSEAIKLNSSDAGYYCNRANVYQTLGKTNKALEDYAQAVQVNPNYLPTYIQRGNIYVQAKKYLEAYQDLAKAIELGENNFTTLSLLNTVCLKIHYLTTAYNYLSIAKNKNANKSSQYPYLLGAIKFIMKDYVNATEHFDEAIKLESKGTELWIKYYLQHALAQLGMGQLSEAADSVLEALDSIKNENNLHTYRLKLHTLQALIACKIKNYDKASIELSLLKDNENDSYCIQGIIQFEQEKNALAAIESFTEAIEIQKDKESYSELNQLLLISSYTNRAYLYYLQGDYHAALYDAQQARSCMELAGKDIDPIHTTAALGSVSCIVLFNEGLAEYQLGNNKSALACFLAAQQAYDIKQPDLIFSWLETNLFEWQQLSDYIEAAKIALEDEELGAVENKQQQGLNKFIKLQSKQADIHLQQKRYENAIDLYTQLHKKDNSNENFIFNRGIAYYKSGQFSQALFDFDKTIEIDKMSGDAYSYRAFTYCKLQRYDEANKDAEAAIKYGSVSAYLIKGFIKYECNNEIDTAVSLFAQTINRDVGKSNFLIEAYSQRAFAYYQKQAYSKAQADSEKVIKLYQENKESIPAIVYFNQGLICYQLSDYKTALQAFKAAKQAQGTIHHAITLPLTLNLDEYARYEEYLALIEQGLYQDSQRQSEQLAQQALTNFQLNHYQEALTLYNQAIEFVKKADYFAKRGSVQAALNKVDLAILDLTEALRLDNQRADYYYQRGLQFEIQQKFELALSDYSQALTLNQKLADAYYRIGCILLTKKEYGQAIEHLSSAIECNKDVNYYRKRGKAFFYTEQYANALLDINNALKMQPENNTLYQFLGLTQAALGTYQEAINSLTRFLSQSMSDINSRLSRGFCQYLLGNPEQALGDYSLLIRTLQNQSNKTALCILLFSRGLAYQALEKFEEALDDIKQAQILFEQGHQQLSDELWVMPPLLEKLLDAENILNHLRVQYKKQRRDKAQQLILAGEELLKNEAYEQAISHCEEGLSLDETCHEAYWLLGTIYQRKDNWSSALSCFITVKTLAPSFPGILIALANAEKQLNLKMEREEHQHWLEDEASKAIIQNTLAGIINGIPINNGKGLEVPLLGLKGKFDEHTHMELQKTICNLLPHSHLLDKNFKKEYIDIVVYKLVERLLGVFTQKKSQRSFLSRNTENTENLLKLNSSVTVKKLENCIIDAFKKAKLLIDKYEKKISLNYTAPATLFAPPMQNTIECEQVNSTVEISSPRISVVNTIFKKPIEPHTAVVALMCNKREVNEEQYEHAFLISIQLSESGFLHMISYHFVQHPLDKRFGLVNISEEQITISPTDDEQEILKKQNEILEKKKFAEFGIEQCHYQAFTITHQQAIELHEKASLDAARSRQKEMGYFLLGNKSIMNISSSRDKAHNCFTWAREKLAEIGKPLNENWQDYFVARTSNYLIDKKQCLMM